MSMTLEDGEISETSLPMPSPEKGGEISRLTEHLFRHEAGKLVSILTGIFGIERLHLAEDVVQDALVRAFQTWPYYGIPKNPAAWLTQTAKNLTLDLIRREKLFRDKQAQIIPVVEQWSSGSPDAHSAGIPKLACRCSSAENAPDAPLFRRHQTSEPRRVPSTRHG